jgi:catechol-2,3-dioxygenase
MTAPALVLDHLNIPARDPIAQARWYAETFSLRQDEHRARGPGVLLVFQAGEPLGRGPELHLGFRLPDRRALDQWAGRFEKPVYVGPEFSAIQVTDPEGNVVELYAPNTTA